MPSNELYVWILFANHCLRTGIIPLRATVINCARVERIELWALVSHLYVFCAVYMYPLGTGVSPYVEESQGASCTYLRTVPPLLSEDQSRSDFADTGQSLYPVIAIRFVPLYDWCKWSLHLTWPCLTHQWTRIDVSIAIHLWQTGFSFKTIVSIWTHLHSWMLFLLEFPMYYFWSMRLDQRGQCLGWDKLVAMHPELCQRLHVTRSVSKGYGWDRFGNYFLK